MAWRDAFSRRSPLQQALERGLAPGGSITDELRKFDEKAVRTQRDAEAVCDAIVQLLSSPPGLRSESDYWLDNPLDNVLSLILRTDASKSSVFDYLVRQGSPLLIGIVDRALDGDRRWPHESVFTALMILADFGTADGAGAIVRAANAGFNSTWFHWHGVLGRITDGHPQRTFIFDALGASLPRDFIGVCLLNQANQALIEGADFKHPFDTPAGHQRLEQLLVVKDGKSTDRAIAATVAMPFISNPARDRLLAIMLDHPVVDVQIEAAWAAAKLKREAGVRLLAQYCLDINQSVKAQRYLEEIKRGDAIPEAARDEDFAAIADFAQWLAHPSELGRPADELEVIDKRYLPWPPERDLKPFWLIKYIARDPDGLKDDDVGVGLVGSSTFCFFSYDLHLRPPEDAYAIHCCWELERAGLEIDDVEIDDRAAQTLLRQWTGPALSDAKMLHVARFARELEYPQPKVGIAEAKCNGRAGWAVLDGPRSRFYSREDFREDRFEGRVVLKIHLGRQLLGFPLDADRRSCAAPPAQKPDAHRVEAFERVLRECETGRDARAKHMGARTTLGEVFKRIVEAIANTRGIDRHAALISAYERLLTFAKSADADEIEELLDNWAVLGKNVNAYVEALAAVGRGRDARSVIAFFAPHFEHPLGYGVLADASSKSGHDDLAESFCLKLKDGSKEWCRSEYMSLLAELWHRRGKTNEAHALLIEAMQGVQQQSRTAKGSDRELFEKWFQTHRETYLQLFPARGQKTLSGEGIRASTLK